MNIVRRRVFVGIVVIATVALVAPFIGRRASAASSSNGVVSSQVSFSSAVRPPSQVSRSGQSLSPSNAHGVEGRLSPKVIDALGIPKQSKYATSAQIGQLIASRLKNQLAARSKHAVTPQSGEPVNMSASAAFSTGIVTSEGGRNTQFNEVLTLGDWDGLEDLAADHSGKVDDFSGKAILGTPGGDLEFTITREAISEHTIANGFLEDIFYYGDSFGNVYVGATTDLGEQFPTANVIAINLPTVLNQFGSLNSDDQIVVTGLAVDPVADLTSFSNIDPNFATFANQVGEILYVTFTDTESGFNLTSSGTLVRSGVLAFPVADLVSVAPNPPGIVSTTGFPVTVGGAFGVAFSTFSNVAGCAVDDDGSVYFQQVDLVGFTGGNIIKVTSLDDPLGFNTGNQWQDRSLAVNQFLTLTSLTQLQPPPVGGGPATESGAIAKQANLFTDYSGEANLFGNIEALSAGPCNTVYAAVARSGESGDDSLTQDTEGFFSTAGTALGATPTMIIRFSDVVGSFAPCSVIVSVEGPPIAGVVRPAGGRSGGPPQFLSIGLPIGDGVADVAMAGQQIVPGVNNFRVFALGNGPDIRSSSAASAVGATTANTLRIIDGPGFQVDPTIHSGITVNEEGTVYVVSGGTPAGIGKNPSAGFGEILIFPDS
ncbi:MAG: hypothetical protein ACREDR_03370, partial [Blastocatellia bacterium]